MHMRQHMRFGLLYSGGELVDQCAHPVEQVGVLLWHLLGELHDRHVGILGGAGDLVGGGVGFLAVEDQHLDGAEAWA